MFQAISGSLTGSLTTHQSNSPLKTKASTANNSKTSSLFVQDMEENDENSNLNNPSPNFNVNTGKRSKLSKRASTNFSFPNLPLIERKEVEDLIIQLQNELKIKESMISSLGLKIERLEDEAKNNSANALAGCGIQKRQHPVSTVTHMIQEKGKITQMKMGTRGSVETENLLQAIADPIKTESQIIATKFIQVFQNPVEHMAYLESTKFSSDLMTVCMDLETLLEAEPRCLFMQSPVYVFGDIHGNLEDLHFFSDNVWKLGMDLTAGKFLFLGDYVDRGKNSLECVAYLFGLKLLYPTKIHLLRGNHETRDVNGWEDHYGDKCFLHQCKERFGRQIGENVWEQCNQVFDRLSLAAVIDHEIFCCHGGIPRPVKSFDSELQAILDVPNVVGVMPAYDHETAWMKQVAADCLWSDPASEAMERQLGKDGFGDSPRGGGAVCFGATAIDNFLDNNGLSYIIRAHEAHSHGVSLSKGARVFTVFSTSKDHRQGSRAMAGCILVDFDLIQVINRSPKYKNKYVHRKTSLSVSHLSSQELDQRKKLGLIRTSVADAEYYRLKQEMILEEHAEEQQQLQSSSSSQRFSLNPSDAATAAAVIKKVSSASSGISHMTSSSSSVKKNQNVNKMYPSNMYPSF